MKTTRIDREKFIQLYNDGVSYDELAATFGVSDRYARVFRDRLGLPRRRPGENRREVPEDFAKVVDQMGLSKARTHFCASWATVARWAKQLGIERTRHSCNKNRGTKVVEVPADWHKVAPTLYKTQLMTHYGISYLMVRRLLDITGVKSRPTAHDLVLAGQPRKIRAKTKVKTPRRKGTGFFALQRLGTALPSNDNVDIYGQAANYLRRHYQNIFRCDIKLYINQSTTYGDEHDVPNKGRDHYFVAGVGIVHKDELLTMAVKRGFVTQDNEVDLAQMEIA